MEQVDRSSTFVVDSSTVTAELHSSISTECAFLFLPGGFFFLEFRVIVTRYLSLGIFKKLTYIYSWNKYVLQLERFLESAVFFVGIAS